jgi:hypothetical protein
MQWTDDNPYFLLMVALDRKEDGSQDNLLLDLGEPGWATTYADWLRRPAEWYLCEKAGEQRVVIAQMVYAGDQPYYVKRNIGQLEIGTGRYRQVEVHGIGKKVPATYGPGPRKNSKPKLVRPERTDRIWILPHGVICGGEDVEKMALAVVSTMEWQEPPPEEPDAVRAESDRGDGDGDRPVPPEGDDLRELRDDDPVGLERGAAQPVVHGEAGRRRRERQQPPAKRRGPYRSAIPGAPMDFAGDPRLVTRATIQCERPVTSTG